MAKTKTPFFGLSAQGSVGESLTAQKRNSTTLLREKPLPTDPYSLPQAYQRWLYEDYAYLWTQQSTATRAEYRTGGSRFHLTGFQYWMKVMLKTLPDIAGWWRLDERTGIVSKDSSKNANAGIILGPSFTPGFVDHALYFDGVNDRVAILGGAAALDLNDNFTIETILQCTFTGSWQQVAWWGQESAGKRRSMWISITNGYLAFSGYGVNVISTTSITDGLPHHCAVSVDDASPNSVVVYVDGVVVKTGTAALIPYTYQGTFLGVEGQGLTENFKGIQDNTFIYNRILDATEIKRHSARRYPT